MRKEFEQPGNERWRAFFQAIKRVAEKLDAMEQEKGKDKFPRQ